MKKLLIGGQALRNLGSDRHTEDVDYLINYKASQDAFLHSTDNIDYCNANANKFFAEVWNMESENESGQASPQSLLELKAYSFVQHCLNFCFKKADSTEYDIKFLVRVCGVSTLKIASKYMTDGQLSEVKKIINSVKF